MDSCIADPVRDCHGAAKTLNTCARQKCEIAVRASVPVQVVNRRCAAKSISNAAFARNIKWVV